MTSELVVRLPFAPNDAIYWWGPDGVAVEREGSPVDRLRAIASRGAGRSWRVLVPGERVSLHSLELTGRLTRTVAKTLPWRLEDDLAEEVSALHVAVLGQSPGQVHLGVVARSWMTLWQGWLGAAGLESRQWLPDTLALPWAAGECTLLNLDDRVRLRFGPWQAGACDSSWQSACLASLPDAPEGGFKVCTLEDPASLGAGACASSANLLQGEWQPQSGVIRAFKPWRRAAGLLLVTLVLLVAVSLTETGRLQSESLAINRQARAIYQQLFPGERVVRLESQLNSKLSRMKPAAEDSRASLPALLNAMAPVFLEEPMLKTGQLDYDHDRQELRLEAESTAFESFARLRERARDRLGNRVSVTVQSVEQDSRATSALVRGTLIIRWNPA